MAGGVAQLRSVERLWWTPGAVLHGLELETEGFRLEAERLEVQVAFLPLLWGEVRPRQVELSDAKLTLKGGKVQLPDLPWEATWGIHGLDLHAPVVTEDKQVLHVRQASLTTGLDGATRLEVLAGASAKKPISLRIQGEAAAWGKAPLPQARLSLNLEDLPAQPLVGYLAKDQQALQSARLDGLLTLTTQESTLIAEGRILAESSSGEQLLELQFRAQATPEGLVLDTAQGTLAGNQVQANGQGRLREDEQWEVELQAALPDGRIDDDTVRLLHEALGREVLGFADHLRGRFAAEMKLTASRQRQQMTGVVDLQGMNYAPLGLPAVEDLRGRLTFDAPTVEFKEVAASVFDVPVVLRGGIRGRQIALKVQTGEVSLADLPIPIGDDVPVENFLGTAQVSVEVGGQMDSPEASGVVSLREAGFDFRRAPVRDVSGQVGFSLRRAEFDALSGRAGGCEFEASGEFVPAAWRETARLNLELPDCELSQLLQLADQADAGPIPWLEPEELTGTGTVSARYRDQELDGWLEVGNGRWSPAWLMLPVQDIAAKVSFDSAGMELESVGGTIGTSPVSLHGRVRFLEGAPAWQLELRTTLQPPDAERLLHGLGPTWLRFPGEVRGLAQVTGSADAGTRLQADFQVPMLVGGGSAEGESNRGDLADPPRLQLQGVWQNGVFTLEQLTATVGATRLAGAGRIRLSPDQHLDLRFEAPTGSSVSDLLALVRLPEVVGVPEGQVGATIEVTGPIQDLQWGGFVNLEEIHIPELLTEPVSLNGRLELGGEGIEVQNLEIRQPNGAFTMAGLLRPRGRSELKLRGAWANLDRLLGQLGERSYSLPARNQFLARHPLRMKIDIDQVQFLGLVFDQVEGELEQADSRFTLRVPRFGLAGGEGSIEVTPIPGTDRIEVQLDLQELHAATLLEDLLKRPAAVGGPLNLSARLAGPLGSREVFLQNAEGEVTFSLGKGRLQRGTLPERLFALAVLLREGLYGFGLGWLTRIGKPHDLDRFQEWTGTVRVDGGKALIEETEMISKVYDVTMTGEIELATSRLQIHGEGNFHPGWEFDVSLKAAVGLFTRLFRLARGRRGHNFEFDVSGTLGGRKSVENFKFKD